MICDALTCADGLRLRQVTASYSIPTLGQFDQDPLLAKTRWRWVPSTIVQPTDRDYTNNPYEASNNIPFDQLGNAFKGQMDLTATRNEPFYDAAKALAIQNRTNSDVITVQGGGVVKKGQAFIVNMGVETDIYDGAPYARITYNFKFKEGLLMDGNDGEYNSFFDTRLDQGEFGWMADGQIKKLGYFSNSDGMAVGVIKLNGNGVPLDPTFKVTSVSGTGTVTTGAAVAPPQARPAEVRTITRTVNSTVIAVYLCFRQFGTYPILSLNL
jgi:hypothetical protein